MEATLDAQVNLEGCYVLYAGLSMGVAPQWHTNGQNALNEMEGNRAR